MRQVHVEHEEDGRWIAEVVQLPGVLAYGATREEAVANAEELAVQVTEDRVAHGEVFPKDSGDA